MEYSVKFRGIEDIIQFVRILNEYSYPADLVNGNIQLDAKSVMAMIAYGTDKSARIRIYADDDPNLQKRIKCYTL